METDVQADIATAPCSSLLNTRPRTFRSLYEKNSRPFQEKIMTTNSRKTMFSMLGSLALVLALSGSAFAQDTTPTDSGSMGKTGAMHGDMHGDMDGMKGMKGMHGNMMGMHKMPATVTTADSKTGVVDVMTEGMALKVHFPAAAMSNLKAGDKITLHMGFSKP